MDKIKLDEKNKKIIYELQSNSRQSYSKVGKKVGLPKTVVAYRINKLIESGLLSIFCTVIDKRKFKLIRSKLYLKFHNYNKTIEKQLLDFLKTQKGIDWTASLDGCYDFCMILYSKDIDDLNDTYSNIINKFNNYILEKDLNIITRNYYSSFNYVLHPNKNEINKKLDPHKKLNITPLDIKIINLMKQNSRIPLLELSQKLRTSPKTIRKRIKYLEDNEVIVYYRIRINHKLLGLHHFNTFINLANVNETKEKEIIDFIRQIPSTFHIVKNIGRYDLEFESILQSHFQLYEIIESIKNKFPTNIQKTDTVLVYNIFDMNTVEYEL